MKWVSRDFAHFDRLATPWLILRFVDPEADFTFLPWGKEDERPADAIPYAIPGVELSSHDEEATTFDRVMIKYRLDDPALTMVARVVRYGVDHILFNKSPPLDRPGAVLPGLMAVLEGIMLASANDSEAIERVLPVLDGLYATFAAENAMHGRGDGNPQPGHSEAMWLTTFISAAAFNARKKGQGFNGRLPLIQDQAFEDRLQIMRDGFANFASHSSK